MPAAALAISWNGLVFTAAGEFAPPGRAATAMAVSNTANYVGAAATPVLGGLVAQLAGWPAMLALGTLAAAGALLALRRLPDPPARSGPVADQPWGDAPRVPPAMPRRTAGAGQGTVGSRTLMRRMGPPRHPAAPSLL